MQKNYFFVLSLLLLALTLIGFRDNLFTDIGQPSNRDPKFVVHGLFCLVWMIVFVVQSHLVRSGRLGLHRQIGTAGCLIAIGVSLSTVYVFVETARPWSDMWINARANRILLPSFSFLIFLAWIYRSRPEPHKRLICIGTLYMLAPVLGRAAGGIPHLPSALWYSFFASLFVYDWVVVKRIHPVTYLGFGWFYAVRTFADLT